MRNFSKHVILSSVEIVWIVSFLCGISYADVVKMVRGTEEKGVIIKELADSIILNTIDGQKRIPRRDVSSVIYAEAEQYYFALGNRLQQEGKLEEAAKAYQRAISIRPSFKQAQAALFSLRLNSWKEQNDNLKKRITILNQMYQFSKIGEQKKLPDEFTQEVYREEEIFTQYGCMVEPVFEMVKVVDVREESGAEKAGLQTNDIIVSIGGQRLEGMEYRKALDMFISYVTELRLSFYRSILVQNTQKNIWSYVPLPFFTWGISCSLQYEGLRVSHVRQGSDAQRAGIKNGDLIISVNDIPVQFFSPRKVYSLMMKNRKDLFLGIEREATIWKENQ